MIVTKGATNVTVYFYIVQDASATSPGEPATGLVFSDIETGGSASYCRQGAARVAVTLVTQTVDGAHTDGGFVEVDATNMPGLYRCDYPDAAFATDVDLVTLQIVVASANNAVAAPIEVQFTGVDLQDATRGGMTALPNANAEAAGGLYTRGTGAGQINQDANGRVDANLAATDDIDAPATWKASINTEVDAALADVNLDHVVGTAAPANPPAGTYLDLLADDGTAIYDRTTDSLQAIRDRGDTSWTTGAGGSDRLLMIDTTIATLSSQTSFTLTDGSADDDAYNNCTIVVEDASTSAQKAVGLIADYTGSTKTVTLKYDPGIFTMATTDKVYILAENALKATDQNRQLDVTAGGTAGIDWGNVENPTTAVDLSGTDIQLCDTTTTNTDMRGTDNAALASVVGALTHAAAAGDPTATDTVVSYLKQLVNTLEGTAGIPTFPAAATAANNVSLAEAIRQINEKTDGLVFTKANEVDANIQSINGTTVNGDGSGTPWGP